MKKIFFLLAIFCLLLSLLTFLNYELEDLETRLKKIEIENKDLKAELNFLKTEWDYINSPDNINTLSKIHLNYYPTELIEISDFLELIFGAEKK